MSESQLHLTLPSELNVRPYQDGESMVGRLMCYWCRHSFDIPYAASRSSSEVTCPHCGATENRDQYMCDERDPLRHPLGWPYDDPTVDYDC
jgi:ribosomal protein S27E